MAKISNGFVITQLPRIQHGIYYGGIDNNSPWPISKDEFKHFWNAKQISFYEQIFDDLCFDEYPVWVLNEEMSLLYWHYCKQKGIPARMIYIESLHPDGEIDRRLHSQYAIADRLLGYDVAECAWDYFSVILNDVIYRPSLLLPAPSLNQNGLLASYEEAVDLLRLREARQTGTEPITFEKGEFAPIAIYAV